MERDLIKYELQQGKNASERCRHMLKVKFVIENAGDGPKKEGILIFRINHAPGERISLTAMF